MEQMTLFNVTEDSKGEFKKSQQELIKHFKKYIDYDIDKVFPDFLITFAGKLTEQIHRASNEILRATNYQELADINETYTKSIKELYIRILNNYFWQRGFNIRVSEDGTCYNHHVLLHSLEEEIMVFFKTVLHESPVLDIKVESTPICYECSLKHFIEDIEIKFEEDISKILDSIIPLVVMDQYLDEYTEKAKILKEQTTSRIMQISEDDSYDERRRKIEDDCIVYKDDKIKRLFKSFFDDLFSLKYEIYHENEYNIMKKIAADSCYDEVISFVESIASVNWHNPNEIYEIIKTFIRNLDIVKAKKNEIDEHKHSLDNLYQSLKLKLYHMIKNGTLSSDYSEEKINMIFAKISNLISRAKYLFTDKNIYDLEKLTFECLDDDLELLDKLNLKILDLDYVYVIRYGVGTMRPIVIYKLDDKYVFIGNETYSNKTDFLSEEQFLEQLESHKIFSLKEWFASQVKAKKSLKTSTGEIVLFSNPSIDPYLDLALVTVENLEISFFDSSLFFPAGFLDNRFYSISYECFQDSDMQLAILLNNLQNYLQTHGLEKSAFIQKEVYNRSRKKKN